MDAVVSQDAIAHAGQEHHRVIKEAARVLKPGGLMAFSDLTQSDDADPAKLVEVCATGCPCRVRPRLCGWGGAGYRATVQQGSEGRLGLYETRVRLVDSFLS